jgi:lipid-A-disaccharide synthase
VKELVADTFKPAFIRQELQAILDGEAREQMLNGYEEVTQKLGSKQAPDEAAKIIFHSLKA